MSELNNTDRILRDLNRLVNDTRLGRIARATAREAVAVIKKLEEEIPKKEEPPTPVVKKDYSCGGCKSCHVERDNMNRSFKVRCKNREITRGLQYTLLTELTNVQIDSQSGRLPQAFNTLVYENTKHIASECTGYDPHGNPQDFTGVVNYED